MLELHKYRHVVWKPSPVVALAASLDGAVVAAARGNGAIEIWSVAAGSVGWHRELTFPGKKDACISCLLWCPGNSSKRGRLFSAGLDGFISEWDFSTLEEKDVVRSYGGSVWSMAIEPYQAAGSLNTDGHRNNDDDEILGNKKQGEPSGELRVAIGCDDGCIRLFVLRDGDSLVYLLAFPRVQGRVLSIAWSVDGKQIYSGGSDGCIRCWDTKVFHEVYRITAGHGGVGTGSSLCVWSLLSLRDGTIVSGDSAGSTQFWDSRHGTLLQAHAVHKADVLSLAAAPSHRSVFSAGADGQVVQYQFVTESRTLAGAASKSNEIGIVDRGNKWVFVGSKRTHSHDVNALVVASPALLDGIGVSNDKRVKHGKPKKKMHWIEHKHFKCEQSVSMLVSGGNDAKLFTYAANAFLAFHPYDVCFAPQRTPVLITLHNLALQGGIMMMSQHEASVELWKISVGPSNIMNHASLGKRKTADGITESNDKRLCNGVASHKGLANGHLEVQPSLKSIKHLGSVKGSPSELLARIKSKSTEHITCSALSNCGHFIAFSDRVKPKLFELEHRLGIDADEPGRWEIRKKRLPQNLPPAHSMSFCGSGCLLLACPNDTIFVVDIELSDVLSKMKIVRSIANSQSNCWPVVLMCTSLDGQWLATSNSIGELVIFNLETFKQHWCIPPLDGQAITAALFHPGNSSVLIVATAANLLHVLDIEERQLTDWSRDNGSRLPRSFLEFPGGIQGLSMAPEGKATSLIAYGPRAMCIVDFKKPVPQDITASKPDSVMLITNGPVTPNKPTNLQNGDPATSKNFTLVPFKDPVLFLRHLSGNLILVVDKPWLDALRHLPPPVYRHVYGT